MIGRDGDEACDKRIRCGCHGGRDTGASSDQDPGAVCSRINVNDGVNGDDSANDDDDDDNEHKHKHAQL
jgi:hypothetical protein